MTGEIDNPPGSGGQLRHELLAVGVEPEPIDQLVDLVLEAVLGPADVGEAEGGGHRITGGHGLVEGHLQHVLHGERSEEPGVLERVSQSQVGPLMGREVGDVAPVEQHPALVGGLEARDQLEHRGLPRAVRPDEADDLSLAHSKRHLIHRPIAGKRLGQVLDLQPRRVGGFDQGAGWPLPLRGAGRGPAQEHRPEYVVALQQVARGPPEAHFALLHEERGFRHRQCHVYRLLDHNDCDAVVVQGPHHVEELLHHHGGEAQRQLVDEEDPGPGHKGHRHSEHVLLAAGQVGGRLVQLLPKAWEHLEHPGGLPFHVLFVPAVQPSAQGDVLGDGKGTEHAPAAGDLGDPERGDPVRRHRGDVGPLERHRPAAGHRKPRHGPQHGGLPRAVGSQQRHEVAFSDLDVDAEQHLHRPVRHVD